MATLANSHTSTNQQGKYLTFDKDLHLTSGKILAGLASGLGKWEMLKCGTEVRKRKPK